MLFFVKSQTELPELILVVLRLSPIYVLYTWGKLGFMYGLIQPSLLRPNEQPMESHTRFWGDGKIKMLSIASLWCPCQQRCCSTDLLFPPNCWLHDNPRASGQPLMFVCFLLCIFCGILHAPCWVGNYGNPHP